MKNTGPHAFDPINYATIEALLTANKTYVRRFTGLNDPADKLIEMIPGLMAKAKERDELQRDLHIQFDTSLHYETDAALLRIELARVRAQLEVCEATHEAKARMIVSLRALRDEARAVVKPFAVCKQEMESDDESAHGGIMAITVRALSDKNLDRARAFLAKLGEQP